MPGQITWINGDIGIITLILSVALPATVALVTKAQASPAVKAVTLIALAAVSGFLSAWQADPHYNWRHGVAVWAVQFAAAVLAHFGLLQPALVTGRAGVIQRHTGKVGIGRPVL